MENNEAKVYKLQYDKKNNKYTLVYDRDKFTINVKLYGDTEKVTDLIKRNFHDFGQKTGALFIGESGSGKTFQAYHTCNRLLELGYDVLFIYGIKIDKDVIKFINDTTFQGVVFMDEFGKLCDSYHNMPALLTTMSDESKHRLWIITENRVDYLPNDIIKRPGRFLFKKEFGRVSEDIIRECCKDHDVSEEFTNDLVLRNKFCLSFNLDTLLNIVNVYKKFPELSLDEMTEIFSFDSLRLFFDLGEPVLYYKNEELSPSDYKVNLILKNFGNITFKELRDIKLRKMRLTAYLTGSLKLDEYGRLKESNGEEVKEEPTPVDRTHNLYGEISDDPFDMRSRDNNVNGNTNAKSKEVNKFTIDNKALEEKFKKTLVKNTCITVLTVWDVLEYNHASSELIFSIDDLMLKIPVQSGHMGVSGNKTILLPDF